MWRWMSPDLKSSHGGFATRERAIESAIKSGSGHSPSDPVVRDTVWKSMVRLGWSVRVET